MVNNDHKVVLGLSLLRLFFFKMVLIFVLIRIYKVNLLFYWAWCHPLLMLIAVVAAA
jgi:hypothetical protein